VQEFFEENAAGTAQKGVYLRTLSRMPIRIAPISEQKRIAAIIHHFLAVVGRTERRLENASKILELFRQAVLAAACSGTLTEDWRREHHSDLETATALIRRLCGAKKAFAPDEEDSGDLLPLPNSWQWVRCEALCNPERSFTYGVIKLGAVVEDGVPTLRSSDVRWLRIEADHIKCISRKIADNYSRTYLQGGEILVTVRGTLGGVAVVPNSMKSFNVSREVAVLPFRSELNEMFFSYAIGSQRAQKWLLEETKGVAYTGINIRDLRRLPLPTPPMEEQEEIVRRVEALFKLADAIEKRVAAATLRAERLTQAILAKAFRGELVPTEAELARREGREYEPASVLLERIRAEKAKNAETGAAKQRPVQRTP
jgi:type I restriction enzyme, S subunit